MTLHCPTHSTQLIIPAIMNQKRETMSRWIWKILFTLALTVVLIPSMQRWQSTISASGQDPDDTNCTKSDCPAGSCGNLRTLQAQLDQATRNLRPTPLK
jgi:hypothetical protein